MAVYREKFAEADPDNFAPDHSTDSGTEVEFYYNPVAEKDYCRMAFPGNRLTEWNQPVREQDKIRFHQQWELYKAGKDQLGGRTLLNVWGEIDPGSVAEYRMMNVQTVEALAAVSDQNLTNFPSGMQQLAFRHREMARAYLKKKEQSSGFNQAIEAAEASQEIAQKAVDDARQAQKESAELRSQLADLRRRLEAQAAPEGNADFPRLHKRKPGGWEYELSDGKIVVGKEAAHQAQALLDAA